MKKFEHYSILSDLFRYPKSNFKNVLQSCIILLETKYHEASHELKFFLDYVNSHSDYELEELYTKTFDVQPICYIDLGYVIFGEDYKRGAFLLHMQNEQIEAENDCGTDLPDNLSNVLTLISISQKQDFIDELVIKIIIPAVQKIIAEFEQSRIEMKMSVMRRKHNAIIQQELNVGNLYRNMFTALLIVLEKDFEDVQFEMTDESVLRTQHHKSFLQKSSLFK